MFHERIFPIPLGDPKKWSKSLDGKWEKIIFAKDKKAMEFRTRIEIGKPPFAIGAQEEVLLVGSCFADNLGKKFIEEKFLATANPYGVMYNPASILHTLERYGKELADGKGVFACRKPAVAILTFGTNHVYRLKSTGKIVDNCQKRPQQLFTEEELGIETCLDYMRKSVGILKDINPYVNIIITVSPIRYAKYGFHGSQLSKGVLLLATDILAAEDGSCTYFPAYEIILDELRDYRFYKQDMLHPSDQAVDYIWERFTELFLSDGAKQFIKEWNPIKNALGHRPFDPESPEYKAFIEATLGKIDLLKQKYPRLEITENIDEIFHR